jgi:hypothetical protein
MNRVIYKNNLGLTDISAEMHNYLSKNFTFTYLEGDFIYIGARLPFNHVYMKMDKFNETSTNVKIEYYDGNQWREVVDVIDSTNGLKNNGHIEFTPDKEHPWWRYDTNYSLSVIEELKDVTIYDRFWLRISFDEVLTEVELSHIGNIFSDDEDLKIEYPDLLRENVISAFDNGKDNWEDQHLRASHLLIKDLIDIGVIDEKGQILNWRDYTDASIHKVAEIVFNSFGDSYVDNSEMARKEYKSRLNKRIHRVDRNQSAIESTHNPPTGFMTR